MNSFLQDIFDTSDAIKDGRDVKSVYIYGQSEMGELADEINIATGMSNKPVGKDGIVGEAIDAIICLVDLIHIHKPDMTPDQLQRACWIKLAKWNDNKVK